MTLEDIWDAGVEIGQRFASDPQARTEGLLVAILLAVSLSFRRRRAVPAERVKAVIDAPRGTKVALDMGEEEDGDDAKA